MTAITATEAFAFVADMDRALGFYRDRLGFTVAVTHGEPVFFALVTRDAARLALRHMDEPVYAGDVREREDLLSAAFTLASAQYIKALAEEFEARGATLAAPLTRQPWGAMNLTVRDPDGNLILFAAPV